MKLEQAQEALENAEYRYLELEELFSNKET